MTIQEWINIQNNDIQMKFWQQVSHLLSNIELKFIMNGVQRGQDLMELHEELNVFTKYQVDMLRVLDIIRKRYPDNIIC
ncbi:MAG: hypothetical protein B6241_12760 [Spirochaetaceae bacterium 4572_59]|nr:MAG: hypothetical protein B6241_12760 [Spirochaetaceae bacterium 4572_59]